MKRFNRYRNSETAWLTFPKDNARKENKVNLRIKHSKRQRHPVAVL